MRPAAGRCPVGAFGLATTTPPQSCAPWLLEHRRRCAALVHGLQLASRCRRARIDLVEAVGHVGHQQRFGLLEESEEGVGQHFVGAVAREDLVACRPWCRATASRSTTDWDRGSAAGRSRAARLDRFDTSGDGGYGPSSRASVSKASSTIHITTERHTRPTTLRRWPRLGLAAGRARCRAARPTRRSKVWALTKGRECGLQPRRPGARSPRPRWRPGSRRRCRSGSAARGCASSRSPPRSCPPWRTPWP
jgi:hypothetical protein